MPDIKESQVVLSEKIRKTDEYKEMYLVLINQEEQYSLWPSYKLIPYGWRAVCEELTKEECLEYIDKNWTDMRPLSLRKQMEKSEQ